MLQKGFQLVRFFNIHFLRGLYLQIHKNKNKNKKVQIKNFNYKMIQKPLNLPSILMLTLVLMEPKLKDHNRF
jgi:hypothetical protein